MLSPELRKLMVALKNHQNPEYLIDGEVLLEELQVLDNLVTWDLYNESLSLSSGVCPTCGRKL